MPQFSDDLFLGPAQTYMGTNATSNLGDPAPMDLGDRKSTRLNSSH